MDFKTKHQRRVRFADSVGLELASIFLFDLINLATIHRKVITHSKPITLKPHNANYEHNNKQQLDNNNHHNNHHQHHSSLRSSLSSSSTTTSSSSSLSSSCSQSSSLASSYSQNQSNCDTPIALPYKYNSNNSSSSSSISKNNNNHHHYNYSPTYTSYPPPVLSSTSPYATKAVSPCTYSAASLNKSNSGTNQISTSSSSLSSSSSSSSHYYSTSGAIFNCEFIQPISLLSFKERVKLNKVHLETCQINSTAGHVSVTCVIRVLNCSYDKSVIVRYTTDDWRTHTDSLASYIPGSCDGWSDKFTSTFTLTNQVKSFQPGQRIIFAIRYMYDGTSTHWDNNGGLNYSIKKV